MLAEAALCILKGAGSAIPQELTNKITRTVSYLIFYGRNVADIPTMIEKLKNAKDEVEARSLVAETNGEQIRHNIHEWLSATNEIIEKFESMESKNCFSGSYEIGKMLDEIEKMMGESEHFRWVSYPAGPPQIGSRYRTYNKSLLSREKVLVEISKALKDRKSNMISVHGIPGVGKTTLFEELVKHAEADEIFQVIAKVDVSQPPDVKTIQSSIAARIQLDLPEQGGIDLDRIGIPFSPEGEPSCTILLSSRSSDMHKKVGENYNFPLDCLDLVEAKILFRDTLGSKISVEEYKSEKYISMENDLLLKCGGLPRAITALAEVLKVRCPHWDDVASQLIYHEFSEVDGVTKTLHQSIKLSYDLVEGDRKKNFFLLGCLFHAGRSIAIEDLMRYGIGLNLFGKIISLEDVTQRVNLWINKLKSLSLFESKQDDQGCISVHNIIQEFSISVASERKYLLLLDDGTQWVTREICKSYTIISMSAKFIGNRERLSGKEFRHPNYDFKQLDGLALPKLEALFLNGESSNLGNGYFKGMGNLTALSMTKMKLFTLPPSIEYLKKLITLCLEDCYIEDATLLSILVSLKVLSLRGSIIKAFPTDIGQLGDLRLLDITSCCIGTILDGVVADLCHLEGLYMCGSFTNQDKDTVGMVRETLVRGLQSFARLKVLEIEIPSTYIASVGDLVLGRSPVKFKIAIGCNVPSPYREFSLFKRVLLLKEIDAGMFSKQGLRDLLKRADCLSLVGIANLKKGVSDLDEDGLTGLNCLHISHCNQMEYIVNTMGMPFEFKILPQLETLSLEHLLSLKAICHGRTTRNWCSELRGLKLSYLIGLKPHALPDNSARKLAAIEVRDCAGLECIFSKVATSETNMTGEVYDAPCLKKLDLQRLPSLQALWAGENTMNDKTYQPLFHGKMNLPSIEELYLSSLDKIEELWEFSPSDSTSAKETFSKLQNLVLDKMPRLKHVWSKELCEGSLSFGNLKKLNITDCALLQSICPPSVPTVLSRLDSLEIVDCDNLKQVLMTETKADNIIEFPSLQRLKLEKLSSLQCFCEGSYTIKFPSLKMLFLSSLPKMLTFLEPKNSGTFIGEIVFPSLEHLEVSTMEDIVVLVDEGHATIAFPKLKSLAIDSLGKLEFIPETILNKLEELKVRNCNSLQGLFEVKSTTIWSLRNLELVGVRSLKHITWNSFPNLHSLVIHGGLRGMKSIISSTGIVQGNVMHQLEYINIELCEQLEEIVSKECAVAHNLLKNGASIFPQLKHIKLHNLPNIATFSSGSYGATFRALEKVEISSCPSFVSFTLGTLETPKLKFLQVDQTPILQPIDLNSFTRCQKQEEGSEQGELPELVLQSTAQPTLEQMNSTQSDSGRSSLITDTISEEDKRQGEIKQPVRVPKFGDWNENPGQAEGYTVVFSQLQTEKRTPGRNTSTPHNLHCTLKKHPKWRGNIRYKAMDKLKRVCDGVLMPCISGNLTQLVQSGSENIGVLQTKTKLLMEKVAEVQSLLISEENDSKDEVQQWLAEADEILKEAKGIIDGMNNIADKKRICSTIDKILEERKKVIRGPSYCKNLRSRENMLQEIMEALLDIHINIFGMYGMIGVGKTVLAEELARHAQSNQLFDAIVMVQVSGSLDVKLIQTQIANKIGLQLETVDDEETRAHILYNALEKKIMYGKGNEAKPRQKCKILVILDGIQRVIDLRKVGIPYGQEGRPSCKVVLISRNADICKNMGAEKQFLVDCLNLDEAKILFQEKLGDKIQNMEIALERYQYMGNVLLIKCRGLPLVIYSLACAMRPMSWSNWEIIVEQLERHTLVEVDEVKKVPRAILELCNNFIQKGEKQKLFLLCCLIQQGIDLTVARLLRYGVGLGLFEGNSLASIVDQINSWVDELKSLSLLLGINESHHLMMHDIVQDVVVSALSQGDYILPVVLDAGTCWHTRESYENCAAITMTPDSNYKCLNGLELHKLQACLLKGKPFLRLPDNFFRGMRSLKILDIFGITFVDFPSSVGDLKNLVTLQLEYCDIKCSFISTISNLTNLEVLSLRESSVETLPEEIGNLTNLRVLDLTRCNSLRTFCVDALAKLDRLRGLYLYDICWDWSTDDMKKLKSLPLEVLEI